MFGAGNSSSFFRTKCLSRISLCSSTVLCVALLLSSFSLLTLLSPTARQLHASSVSVRGIEMPFADFCAPEINPNSAINPEHLSYFSFIVRTLSSGSSFPDH